MMNKVLRSSPTHEQGPAPGVPIDLPSGANASGRNLGADELAFLAEVIQSGTLNCTRGTQVAQFEKAFAALHGVEYARAVCSGTAAIHTAIAALDPEPGDEIITSPITDMGAPRDNRRRRCVAAC